jgi:hypothetical protein
MGWFLSPSCTKMGRMKWEGDSQFSRMPCGDTHVHVGGWGGGNTVPESECEAQMNGTDGLLLPLLLLVLLLLLLLPFIAAAGLSGCSFCCSSICCCWSEWLLSVLLSLTGNSSSRHTHLAEGCAAAVAAGAGGQVLEGRGGNRRERVSKGCVGCWWSSYVCGKQGASRSTSMGNS